MQARFGEYHTGIEPNKSGLLVGKKKMRRIKIRKKYEKIKIKSKLV